MYLCLATARIADTKWHVPDTSHHSQKNIRGRQKPGGGGRGVRPAPKPRQGRPTTSQDEDDEVVEVDPSEVAWHNFQAMVPNCYGKSKITLETPPLELLPYRSWPAKMRYTLSIDKIAASNRPTTGLALGMAVYKFP